VRGEQKRGAEEGPKEASANPGQMGDVLKLRRERKFFLDHCFVHLLWPYLFSLTFKFL
jgi:hypothetical protein